jgi:chemotaxis protein MotB
VGPSLRDKYPSNWELSSARAGAVLRYLTEERGLSTDRFEMAGFGAARPVATNETAAGRRRNRRVRVSVLPEVRE